MKNRVRFDTPRNDGSTLRENLLAIARIPGAPRPPELDTPTEPEPMFEWLWQVFWTLSSTRGHSPNGCPTRITHQEILAWCQLYGERLSKCDLGTIRALDVAYINTRIEVMRAS